MNSRAFCTYVEYRFSYELAGLIGIMTGLVDALVDDWSIKAFLWSAILLLYTTIVSYMFIVMDTPPKPLLQAILFQLSILGILSTHHFVWYIVSVMIGRKIEKVLWLAPNIYMDFTTYTVIAIAMYVIYVVYKVYINMESCD